MTQPKDPQEPRQFWLDLATRHGDPCDFISEGKPWEIVSSTNIHVIEYSAYQALQQKVSELEAENKRFREALLKIASHETSEEKYNNYTAAYFGVVDFATNVFKGEEK